MGDILEGESESGESECESESERGEIGGFVDFRLWIDDSLRGSASSRTGAFGGV
jgi:hypothetical protein